MAEGAAVRAPMGLHTAEPEVGDERYVGLGVHQRPASAAAHGGQVLLSDATRALVESEVGDVGPFARFHRLKDFDQPERLYQLDIGGLQTDFPPLRAAEVDESVPARCVEVDRLSALVGVIAAAIAVPIFAFGQSGGGEA